MPSEWFERSFIFEGFFLLSIPLPPPAESRNSSGPVKPEIPQQQEVYCFLFNDCIVFTRHSEKKGNYKFISKYSLHAIKLQSLDDPEGNWFPFSVWFLGFKFSFSLNVYNTPVQPNSQPTNIFTLSCNSQTDKDMWVKKIMDAKAELEKSRGINSFQRN